MEAETGSDGKIVPRLVEQEMKESYLEYSMSVIVGRALPSAQDGLKPVHRRILFAMHDLGMFHNKPSKKSARIVGEVLGKYHPHGDTAVYDSLVRMAQDFSLRYPLIQGQGNFGSVDGDSAAAMRYTEARLSKIAEEMLQDIDKETVKFLPNFDGSLTEPSVLPSKIPNLLINGSSGIAVGMATNIPPHNIVETCEAIIKSIENPKIEIEELMQTIKAPDFPTGGIIIGTNGIKEAYKTGKGKVVVRARTTLEEVKNRTRIIVTEIPYMVNKAQLIKDMAELVKDKKITEISDLRDESNREGMRIVIELKIGANSDVLLNKLYKHTRLQDSFGINILALVDNQPKVLTLRDLIDNYILHRRNIVRKRIQYDLKQAENKAHILEGLLIALKNIDAVIQLIKKSKATEEAKKGLIEHYKVTEKQAQAILDMTLKRLTNLEQTKIKDDHAKLIKIIKELKEILADELRILAIIKKELKEIIEKYGDERKTQITEGEEEKLEMEQLIKPEETVITITHAGYVKRILLETYKQQKRGGKGIKATETKEEDFVANVFTANTHDNVLFFTNTGKVHWLKVYQIPEAGRYAKGTAIVNILQLSKDERITTTIPIKEFKKDNNLFMVTRNGTVKKTSLEEFSHPRKGGIKAVNIGEGDELIKVLLTDGSKQIMLATANGNAVKFDEKDVREMGRTAGGVRGIKLKGDDKVIGAIIAQDDMSLLTATEKGYGKRTLISDYRLISRGGSGVINIKITEKNGKVVGIVSVTDHDEIMLITQNGILIRMPTKDISVIGRNTQGVRIIKLGSTDRLKGITKVKE